ncbi:MAG TPA: HAD-IA family hydrolase [Terriglobales bacterium]|nr:HAD-IA family hydrolase [Terriglobales bacterium]
MTAVLLDLYETLADADSESIAAGRRRGAELAGVDPGCLLEGWTKTIDERSVGRMGSPEDEIRRLLDACDGPAGEELIEQLVALEADNWRSGVRLYADVLPALAAMRRDGSTLAIVSNCSWQTAGVMRATGLDAEVDATVLSFDVGLVKPDPAILRLALERLGVAPSHAALVDDVPANLDAARALGMATVLMDRIGAARGSVHPAVRDLAAAAATLRG